MSTDRQTQEQAARRERGRRLAWIAVGGAVAATLVVLGPAPATDAPRGGLRLIDQSSPSVPQHMASLSAEIDWDAIEPSADPAPLAVAAYEH